MYPGWKVRLYTDTRGRADVLCPLLHRHASILFLCDIASMPPALGNLASVNPMLWRVLPLGDPQVAAMLVRDSDSTVGEATVLNVKGNLFNHLAGHVTKTPTFKS